ncbi:PH domain-containing protein [Actinocorallia sp. A-T 12471]|uniref:PH domain-containing protein n=1 Tax=Actinocorallia sp. A-T 12471 TaxID=3089813 RepID=UPI0029CECD8F|nr:PH domain-containing protein [Actinocorallia sp. A-T 12471]MDX6744515.1 PH domain-containing protein [Actinocorallia sp. A-T 12471]
MNFVDLGLRGRDKTALVVAIVLALTCGVAYVMGLRPKVRGDAEGVTVDNPLRTTRLPWGSVRRITTGRALGFDHVAGHTESWAVQVSARKAANASRAKPEDLASRTPVTFAADELETLRTAHKTNDGTPQTTWSIPALAALLVPLAALIAAVLL